MSAPPRRLSCLKRKSELKALQSQINPHFLFNALNTLSAVIRRDPEQARTLVQHLSTFFRKNLKRQSDEVSLRDELEHVQAYLQIDGRWRNHVLYSSLRSDRRGRTDVG